MTPAPDLVAELERLSRASVLVVGDASLERNVYGQFSDQPGSLGFHLGREVARPGAGAAIVAALAALRVATAFVCVLGDDLAGAELTALVGAQANVEPWLLVDGAMSTTTETRYLRTEHPSEPAGVGPAASLVLRTVREDRHPMHPKIRERMLRIAGDAMMATSLTVLSDRGHGTLDVETATAMLDAGRQSGRRMIAEVALAGDFGSRYRGVDALLARHDHTDDAEHRAARLREQTGAGAAILFLPDAATALADRDGTVLAPAAGDGSEAGYQRLVAGFAAAMATGDAPREALALARAITDAEGWSMFRPDGVVG